MIFLVFKFILCKIYILFIPFQIKFLCCALISATYKLILKPINITEWCEDMYVIFEWWKQYFTNEPSEWVKYCFHHEMKDQPLFQKTAHFLKKGSNPQNLLPFQQVSFLTTKLYKIRECISIPVTVQIINLYLQYNPVKESSIQSFGQCISSVNSLKKKV